MFNILFEKINSLRELNKALARIVSPSNHSGFAGLTLA